MNTLLKIQSHLPERQQYKSTSFTCRLLLVIIGCTILAQAHSQTDKRLVLADKYYDAGDYYTAADLYGQFLKPAAPSKSNSDFPLNSNRNAEGRTGKYGNKTNILFKQAESYRLANYWNEASALYKECFEKDSSMYASALYWYAVCQRSLGNFDSAEESIDLFLRSYAAGTSFKQAATQEKKTIGFIKDQLSRPDTVLYKLNKVQSSENDKGIFGLTNTGQQMLLTSTHAATVENGINPYHNRLFTSTLEDGNLQNIVPVNFSFIDSTMNQGAASISSNGNHLYFTQWKNENGRVISAIYYSTKTSSGWSQPQLMSSVNQTGSNSKQPFCSADGKYLFFSSDRRGGKGQFDIWYAPIKEDGTTGQAINAGAGLNTAGNEQSPFYHSATNTIVFSSDRTPGMGGYDLYTAKGDGSEWKNVENMGYPVNSSRDDLYFFSTGTSHVLDNAFFSSDRGSECCLATYQVSKAPKKKIIKGWVRDCNDSEPLADAEVTMKDVAGNLLQTRTAADGSYSFELTTEKQQLHLNKELYDEKSADISIEGRNETAWHSDTLYNTVLCMEKKLVIKVENVVTVYFDFNQSKLSEAAMAKLDSIYAILLEDSTTTIQISGYTDGIGTAEYNKILSDKRAKSCADYLAQKGIDSARISFESFGACCPVEMELINGRDNPGGRSMNRRALINIDRKDRE